MHDAGEALVEEIFLTFSAPDGRLRQADHPGNLLGVDPGGVDDVSGPDALAARLEAECIAESFDRRNRRIHAQIQTVGDRAFDERKARFIGVDDPGGWPIDCSDYVVVEVRFLEPDPFRPPDLHTRNVSIPGLLGDRLQCFDVCVVEGNRQIPVTSESEPQLLCQTHPALVAGPGELAFERPRLSVVATVDDAAIGLRSSKADLDLAFHESDIEAVSGEFPGNGAADDATTDDCYVLHAGTVPEPPRWR